MSITLQRILDESSLHLSLTVRGRLESLEMPISWVHATELSDPTPYLIGGEIILTSGLSMPPDEWNDAYRLYAKRLVNREVRGVGFGVGLTHRQVPQWLIDQCESTGLSLFEVPIATPFMSISKLISRSLADGKEREFARLYHNEQQLLRSAHAFNPVNQIVSKLAELVGGWAVLLNPAGAIIESSHRFLPIDMDVLGDSQVFSLLGQAKFMNIQGYDIAVFRVASSTGQTLGCLVAGRHGPVASLDHALVAEAVSLLSLAMSGFTDANRSLRRLRTVMMRQCLEGEAESVRRYAKDVWDGMPVEPLTVLRIAAERESLDAAHSIVEPFTRSLGKQLNPPVFGMVDNDLWIIISRSSADAWVERFARDSRLTLGVSSGCTWHDVPRARHEAYQACAQALASGTGVVRFGLREGVAALETMVEPSMLRAFSDVKLAPILSMTFNVSTGPHAGEGTDVDSSHSNVGADIERDCDGIVVPAVDVLRAWLESRGRPEPTARLLGLHRHTVTKYIRLIADALSVDLAEPGTMAELWYACKFVKSTRGPVR